MLKYLNYIFCTKGDLREFFYFFPFKARIWWLSFTFEKCHLQLRGKCFFKASFVLAEV